MTDANAHAPAGAIGLSEAEEFALLPQRRRLRSPLVALAAAALAATLLYRLYPDLEYALHSHTPVALGDARQVALHLPPVNRYVTLFGVADRSNGALIDTRGKDDFRQLFRLLGTGSRLIVLRTFGAVPTERTLGDRFTGRLIAFSDLSFADSISQWFRKRVVASHMLRSAEVQEHLKETSVELSDLAGDPVRIEAGSLMAVDLLFPDEYRIIAPRQFFPDVRSLRDTLLAAGFVDPRPSAQPVRLPPPDEFILLAGRPFFHLRRQVIELVRSLDPRVLVQENPADPGELYVALPKSLYPSGVAQATRAMEGKGLRNAGPLPWVVIAKVPLSGRDVAFGQIEQLQSGVRIARHTETLERTWAELQASPVDFKYATRVKLIEPLAIADGAALLVEGERPHDYWYVPFLFGILGLFLAFNLYMLAASLRRGRRPAPADGTPPM